ncbi:MAG: hypothetical protein Q9217_003885 [Psora testacea]
MPSQDTIEFFDLPSRPPNAAWSLNPWKTRLILNYKSLPYHTTWLEYPDIEPTFKAVGIPPNIQGTAAYTIPTIKLPKKKDDDDDNDNGRGRYIMDSLKIAQELEKLYPEPSLHLDDPVLEQVLELTPACVASLGGVLMPKVPRTLLNPASVEYFERTRAARFGMPLAQLEKEKGGENAWKEAEPALKKLGELLKGKGGPFFLGEEVSYADFIVVGALECFRRLGDGILERMIEIEPALGRLYEASKQPLERNDH